METTIMGLQIDVVESCMIRHRGARAVVQGLQLLSNTVVMIDIIAMQPK